jgi:hypothetical protein
MQNKQVAQPYQIPATLLGYIVSRNLDDMKRIRVDGGRARIITQALPSLDEHIRAVREEFIGQPELVFYHAALIVKIRREIDLAETLEAFRGLWELTGSGLLTLLNSRWLVSALDTLADHGRPEERGAAMAIATFVNMLKLAETEYRLVSQPEYDPAKVEQNFRQYPVLWDGIRVFHLPDDNTFANMVQRLRRILASHLLLKLLFETLLNAIVCEDTLPTRLARQHIRKMW